MSEPFIAEIRMFAGNFAPRGWAFCDGQLLPIAQNAALFSLIGTTYGGDGRSTTALPNLKGRAPMHPGRGPGLSARVLGQNGGTGDVTLTEAQMPRHNHRLQASTQAGDATAPAPTTVVAQALGRGANLYVSGNSNLATLEGISSAGGNQSHSNIQPFLGINFIIALQGIYPSRS
ncbi:MAG: tail fiber protein [Cyanobacteria bacterium P01_E01_bin.45]